MLKSRLFLASLLVLLLALLAIALAPFAVSNGIRLWVWWAAKQEGFVASIDKIDASFLHPVVIRQLHLKSTRENALRLDLTATDVSVGLNFKHVLLHLGGRIIRNLSIRELRVELHRSNPNLRAITRRGWATLQRLLPENLSIANSEMRVENGPTLILLRRGILSASETEAGRFSAAEIMIASPWFHQTFSQLRGATHWEANRLTLGGLTLSRGLDLQSATADFSRLAKQRVGLQFEVDAFGGKIRGNISHEWRSQHSNWKIAGGASDISLAQTSDAFGFADRVDGLLHAANFTFRGNLAEPDRVTASLWGELTRLTWRNRTAEAIMLGVAVYNRKIELQQLYIRQKSNQFTLSGEAAFPANSSGWLSPDFRGNISASINQLGDFVALFGANPDDFAGKITIEGAMDTRDRKFGGRLALEGASLTLFKTPIDSLSATLNLRATELEVEQLQINHKNDSLTGQGKIDMSHEHNYSGKINATIQDLTPYLFLFGASPIGAKPVSAKIQITIDSGIWDGSASIQIADSKPIALGGHFPLQIGIGWNAFGASPINVRLDVPGVFLPDVQRYFNLDIFRDGILSGGFEIYGTLQRPDRLGLDVRLINGRLENAPLDLTELSGRVYFGADHGVVHGVVDFVHASTKDVELSFTGGIDGPDLSSITITLTGVLPIFDLTPSQVGCVDRIDLAPIGMTLAPAIDQLEFRGALFRPGWTMTLQPTGREPAIEPINIATRTIPLCFGTTARSGVFILGALSRPQPSPARTRTPAKTRSAR